MTRSKVKIILAALAVIVMTMLTPVCVFADSGGYTTEEYNVNVVTDEDYVFHVDEEIVVDFNDYRHGIYRNIPEGGSKYSIKHVIVEGYEYETYTEDSNLVIKIGSADEYVYGIQNYHISYDIVGYADGDTSKDELMLDLIPTGWYTDIKSSKVSVTFPKKIDEIKVYSGRYKDEGDGGYFLVSNNGKELTAVSRDVVPMGVGLTITADLPEGYWVDPVDRTTSLPGVCGLLGAMAAAMLGLWGAVGRDNRVVKPIEFYPPENMDPLQIDYIANDKVEPKDVAALFLYFANKGYLKVIGEGKKKFTLEKIAEIGNEEKHHSKIIFKDLFRNGRLVNTRDLPSGFGETVATIDKDVKSSLGPNQESFSQKSKAGRALGTALCALIPIVAGLAFEYYSVLGLWADILFIIFGLIIGALARGLVRKADSFSGKKKPVKMIINAIILAAAILLEAVILFTGYPLLALAFVVAMVITVIATIFVRKRINNDIYGRVMGFRNFIKTAEYDRLKRLADEDPEYFFNIMPYALVFGMSNKWADKFADFKIPQPSWYEGSGGYYDPYFSVYMFNSCGHGISSSVADYYKEISSDIAGDIGGGGGGGFSGGGFGGGGGGSW